MRSTGQLSLKQKFENQIDFESIQIMTHFDINQQKENQIINLRGGGSGPSQVQTNSKNIGKEIEERVQSIVRKIKNLTSEQYKNEIVLDIQWFIHNRKKLLRCAIQRQQPLSSMIEYFQSLLDIVPECIEINWFICYQILQICNDLVRIIFLLNKKNAIEVELQRSILEKLSNLSKNLQNISPLVWKTGMEFEIILLQIMFTNCSTDSIEEYQKACSFAYDAIKSAFFLISDESIEAIVSGIRFLVKKSVDKLSYPIEVYQVYYLFQITKYEIIQNIKQTNNQVYNQLQTIKDRFEKYIIKSDKWILHFCWISLITDLIIYRPSLKFQKYKEVWSQLIENQLVQTIQYNKKRENLRGTLEKKKEKIIKTWFSFFYLWNHYKDFTFKKNIETERRDYEVELLDKYITQFQDIIDQISINYFEIRSLSQKLSNQDKKNLNQILESEHIQQCRDQFKKAWAQGFFLTQVIKEFALFELTKVEMLDSYLLEKIQSSKSQLKNFEEKLLEKYFELMGKIHNNQILPEPQKEQEQLQNEQQKKQDFNEQVLIDIEGMGFGSIPDLSKNIKEYKKKFVQFINKYQLSFQLQNTMVQDFLLQICSRKWIGHIMQQVFLKGIESDATVQKKISILNQNLSNLEVVKQLYGFQEKKITQVQIKLNQIQNEKKRQLSTAKINLHPKIITILKHISEQLKNFEQSPKVLVRKEMKQFQQQLEQSIEFFQNNELYLQRNSIQDFTNKKKTQNEESNLFKSTSILIQQILINFMQLRCDTQIQIQKNASDQDKLDQKNKQEGEKNLQSKGQESKSIKELQKQLNELLIKWNNDDISDLNNSNQESNDQKQVQQNQNKYIINDIKQLKHFFKSYLKSLKINQNMDSGLQQNNNFYEENYIHQVNKYQQIIQSMEDDKPNFSDQMIDLREFLQFYETDLEQENQDEQENSGFFNKLQSDIKIFYQKIKYQVVDIFEDKDYKVRECLVYHLIKIQQSNLEDCLVDFSTKQLQYIWCYEKDQRVRNLLKNKELVEMQKLFFKRDLQTLSEQIKEEMQGKIQLIDQLQQQIRIQGNQKEREKLSQQLNQVFQDLDESSENIFEMSQIMEINLIFLKDIMKNVKEIKAQIDNLQDSVNKLSDDVRKLRGKKYDELLEIRMLKVFAQMDILENDSVYVQLITRERILPGRELDKGTKLFIDNVADPTKDTFGEINEFIWDQANNKDVMLISGFAGSGKSRAMKKIEECLWKLKQKGQSKWIPIFVSLPTLKNPKFNLFEQALESENYQFDKYQIREFKKAIQDKQEKIILILDSYDEMKADCIQQNLIQTNKLIQELSIDKNNRQVKFIITTRREILTTDGYEKWFHGESLNTYKEIQLLNFNEQQQQDYLIQYCELSVKRIIRALYEFLQIVQKISFDPSEFKKIWQQLQTQVTSQLKLSQENSQDFIFLDKFNQTLKVTQEIRSIKIFRNLTDEQLIGLKKDLESLWNINKFNKTIDTAQLQDLLTTPFMLEIVVQVLPSMIKNYQGSSLVRDTVKSNYNKIIKTEQLSKVQILEFQENQTETNIPISQSNFTLKKTENYEKIIELNMKKTFPNIDFIVDRLESQKFFQKYSLDSSIKKFGNLLQIDQNKFELDPECIDIVIRALKMQNLTAFEFYDNFIIFYHDQQISKLRDLGLIANSQIFAQDVHQYSLSLAIDMTIRDLSQIEYQDKGKLILESNYKVTTQVDNWLDQYLSSSSSDYDYKKLIKSCTLLSAKGSTYAFTHKSIQEFYVAYFIFNYLKSIDLKNAKQELLDGLFNQEKFNISNESFLAACNFIIEKLKTVENMQQKLINIVLLSKDEKSIRASSNSIYLLSLLQVYLGEMDFSSIQLQNTNISKLCFVNSNLSQSIFNNVQIDYCNFNYCNLSGIKWEDIRCQEQPSIQITEQYQQFQFSSDGKNIISISQSGKIEIWDSKNFQKDCKFDENNQFQLNAESQLIFCSQQSDKFKAISEIKNEKLHNIDYQDCFEFKQQQKELSLFLKQTSEYLSVQTKQQLELGRNKKLIQQLEENKSNYEITDVNAPFTFSSDFSVLAFAKYDVLKFSDVRRKINKILKKYDFEIRHLEFCQNGQYFISVTRTQLTIFQKIEQNGFIDFHETQEITNINQKIHKFFVDNQKVYLVEKLKSIRIIHFQENKKEEEHQLHIENYEKELKQENLNNFINQDKYQIHLILSSENQNQQQSQQQFFILFSINQEQIYFINPELRQLQKFEIIKIYQVLIFPNITINKIQFFLITENDKIILFRSEKEKEFKQIFEKQLCLQNFLRKNEFKKFIKKNYTLSEDGKTLFIENQNYLRWYTITENQIIGLGIIQINDLTDSNVLSSYFFNLEYFMIITKVKSQACYKKIVFSEILYQINIHIGKDSKISQSEDELLTLINNQSLGTLLYFNHQNLDLYEFKLQNLYAAEAVDQSSFINVTKQMDSFKVSLCKFKLIDSKITIDSKSNKQLGDECSYYKYFQKQYLLVLQNSNKVLSIINMKNTQKIERVKEKEFILNTAISPDSSIFVYECKDQIKFWNINQIQNTSQDIPQGHQKDISAITFSKDGLLLSSGATDGTIILWDYQSLKYLVQFTEHKHSIKQLNFYIRNSSQILVSCCEKYIVKIWKIEFPYKEKVSSYTINFLCPIETISVSINQISLTYQDQLFIYHYDLETHIHSYQRNAQFDRSFLSNDNQFIYLSGSSLKTLNLETSEEKQIDKFDSKNFSKMIQSDDYQYIIIQNIEKEFSKLRILQKDKDLKLNSWKLINEFTTERDIISLKLSPDNKILFIKGLKINIFYDFEQIQKSFCKSLNILDDHQIYSISDDFEYVIIFEEGRTTIKLKNLKNKENSIVFFSYNNPKKLNVEYQLFEPKLSKNQKYLSAYVRKKQMIVFWEVNNPKKQHSVHFKSKQGKNIYDFSFDQKYYILLVNLEEKEKLIKIYTYDLEELKFDNKIKKIETQISKHYCFSKTHQYFCILNSDENQKQQKKCCFEIYDLKNELCQTIRMNAGTNHDDNISIAFSKDDELFAIRILDYLYGYKKVDDKFQEFLKIPIQKDSIIHIKDKTRFLILENQIMYMLKIDIDDKQIINLDQQQDYLQKNTLLLRNHQFMLESKSFTIHMNEDQILFFNNNWKEKKAKIFIFDLLENILSRDTSNYQIYSSPNGEYFAELFDQNKELKIFKVKKNSFLKETRLQNIQIDSNSIQFLDDETKKIFNLKEGIIFQQQKQLIIYNFIENILQKIFEFSKIIIEFQVKGARCLLQTDESCQIFKITDMQEFQLLHSISNYKGYLQNKSYIQFQSISNLPIFQSQLNSQNKQSSKVIHHQQPSKIENGNKEQFEPQQQFMSKSQQNSDFKNVQKQIVEDENIIYEQFDSQQQFNSNNYQNSSDQFNNQKQVVEHENFDSEQFEANENFQQSNQNKQSDNKNNNEQQFDSNQLQKSEEGKQIIYEQKKITNFEIDYQSNDEQEDYSNGTVVTISKENDISKNQNSNDQQKQQQAENDGDDDDEEQKKYIIIFHVDNLPQNLYSHNQIIKFHQILAEENKVALIDINNNLNVLKIENPELIVQSLKINQKVIQFNYENFFVSMENNNQINIHKKINNFAQKKLDQQLQINNFEQSSLVFSNNGNFFLIQKDNSIEIWNVKNNQLIAESKDSLALIGVKFFALFPDGTSFATGSSDGTVNLYKYYQQNSQSGKNQQKVKQIFCCKSLAIYQIIQSNGCILNEKSKLISSNNKDLLVLFRSRGARDLQN